MNHGLLILASSVRRLLGLAQRINFWRNRHSPGTNLRDPSFPAISYLAFQVRLQAHFSAMETHLCHSPGPGPAPGERCGGGVSPPLPQKSSTRTLCENVRNFRPSFCVTVIAYHLCGAYADLAPCDRGQTKKRRLGSPVAFSSETSGDTRCDSKGSHRLGVTLWKTAYSSHRL